MAKRADVLQTLQQAYDKVKKEEAENLHNDIVEVINEHQASLENIIMVLDLIRHSLMQAKYKEAMGLPPTKVVSKKPKE